MLLKETLEIVNKLMVKAEIDDFEVRTASRFVHNPKSSKTYTREFDILVTPSVSHRELQEIDKILSDYDNVEMKATSEGLLIFEREE